MSLFSAQHDDKLFTTSEGVSKNTSRNLVGDGARRNGRQPPKYLYSVESVASKLATLLVCACELGHKCDQRRVTTSQLHGQHRSSRLWDLFVNALSSLAKFWRQIPCLHCLGV